MELPTTKSINTMKKVLLSVALLLCVGLQAQKLKTRSGYVKFFSGAAVEDITAENNQVSSLINLDNGSFAFLVPIKAFQFEKALMQEHFNENYMESGQFPNATFKGSFEGYEDIALEEDASLELMFNGVMTVHGVSKEIQQAVMLKVKDGKVQVEAEFPLKASDYGIEIPATKSDNISNDLVITVKFDYA